MLPVALAAGAQAESEPRLEVVSEEGTLVASCPAGTVRDEGFSLAWVHSVELEAWQEDFRVNDAGRVLITGTRFRTFGAGTPDLAPEHETRDGWVIMAGFDRIVDPLVIRAGETTDHTFVCDGTRVALAPGQYRISYVDPQSGSMR